MGADLVNAVKGGINQERPVAGCVGILLNEETLINDHFPLEDAAHDEGRDAHLEGLALTILVLDHISDPFAAEAPHGGVLIDHGENGTVLGWGGEHGPVRVRGGEAECGTLAQ